MNVRLCRTDERTLIHSVLAICVVVAGLHGQVLAAGVDVAQVADQVSLDSYMAYLRDDLYAHAGDERAYGPKHDLARQRVQQSFEDFGFTTSLDPFEYNGTVYYNVVGVYAGVTRPREIYIVGAHYDTVAGSPGACDNASGVAGVLEAARVLSQYLFEATIVFIAFDREEQSWKGSTAYANAHAQDDIRGMIALDMIAYQPAEPQNTYVEFWYTTRTEILDDLTVALQTYAGLNSVVTHTVAPYGSDHLPFDSLGFPAALLIQYTPLSYPFIHKPSDSLDQLTDADYDYATQITRGVVGYLATHAGLEPVRVIPDFNGDWKVDIQDLTILIEHWGQADPAFDIAPPLLGDGIVDSKDLEGLMHYWGQEIPEPALAAHWKLDETDAMIAHDSVGTNDATVVGSPIWRPEGGKIGGALELSGVANFAKTNLIHDPSQRSLSVFAWVNGGAPRQVIVSQAGGANWLTVAPTGVLTTELKSAGRFGKSLLSQVVIADGQWHRVGLTWDGSNRVLYVDDVEAARDTQSDVARSVGGLYLGAGQGLEPGSFWAGMIDDVRIYNRAVKP